MNTKILLEIGIIFFGVCLFFIAIIFLISTIIKKQRVQNIISPLIDWIKNKNISLGELVQSITAILALLIALYALTIDSIRDNDSSKRYSESVDREKVQHLEIMNVYQIQTKLLEQYSTSADSMLEMLKIQTKIADMQFENQIILTQPGVNINYQVQDTNNTSLFYDNKRWIMPEIILHMFNYGSRVAEKVNLSFQVISPKAKSIHSFNKVGNLHVLPKATLDQFYFPIIALEDKDFFLIVVDITWRDEFNNNIFRERLYTKFIRENNEYYSYGKAEQIYIELINQIIAKPTKVVVSSPVIREYMYNVYNK